MNMKPTNPCIECDTNWCRAQSEGKKCPAMFYEKPRPHGEWIYKDGKIYCSSCGGESGHDSYGDCEESDFCPNCGAKMKEGGEK